MEETRIVFDGFSSFKITLFYGIGFGAIFLFLAGFALHILKYRRGRSLAVPVDIWAGVKSMILDLLTHRTVRRRDRYAGVAHRLIFYGFAIAFLGTSIITLEEDITKPLFGITFWKGGFYLAFSLIVDLGGLALLVGVVMMMARRAFFGLAKLDYLRRYRGESEYRPVAVKWRVEDWAFMTLLLLITLTGFLQEAVRLMIEQPAWQAWSPVGYVLSKLFMALGMSLEVARAVKAQNWWLHGMLALGFIVAIPWYKAKHILTAIGSLSVRDPLALRRLPPARETEAGPGVCEITQFDWKNLLHLDACTKCGKCHEACPAANSGYPLSPRDFILDLREYNNRPDPDKALIGDVIDPETLWACRSCGACQEICPVGIEHPAMIVQMRRHMVDEGEMNPILQSILDNFANRGNSFGESPKKRSAWTGDLEFQVKDVRRQAADYLWFVGDYAAFDPRNQEVSRTFARLLRAAGIDYGLLHEGERNAGNDVRRIGEEGLFESLAQHNIDEFRKAKKFSAILTTDPHSYNTIRNEYPDMADMAPISHYTTILADLLEQGKLRVTRPLNKRVTFHDPCHLGRLNGGYDGPRRVLAAIGCELVEMPRNRDNSFCCGAGGGRIWIPDDPGTTKPSESRMDEAAELGGIDYFITSCPKDLTMYEDARKTSNHEEDFVVRDIAELVAEAIELDQINLQDVPYLISQITERVTDQVVGRVEKMLDERLAALTVISAEAGAATAPVALEGPAAAPAAPVGTEPEAAWAINPIAPAVLPDYPVPAREKIRILVAVKHVGKILDDFELDEAARDISPDALEYEFNEFDDNALEAALQISETLGSEAEPGAEIIVVCIGPDDAEATLRKALAKGADRGVHIWHESLEGADPVTIARALAGVSKAEQPDLIFTGVQSSDKTNGATGAMLAEILAMPCAAVVVGVDWDGGERVNLMRELEGGLRESFTLPAPCVMTVQTGAFTPRYATMRMIKKAKKKVIEKLDGTGVRDRSEGYVISRLFKPPVSRAEMLEGSMEDVARKVAAIIKDNR